MPNVEHSLLTGTSVHESKRIKEPVRVASTANVTLSAPGAAIDGVTLSVNDRVLLKNQSTVSQNGLYAWLGSAVALARVSDADEAADFFYGFQVYVREGTINAGTIWVYTQSSAVTLGSTSITFSQIVVGSALSDPTTTRGDLITRGASAIGRLAVGTSGQFLGTNGTDPIWTNSATYFGAAGLTGATTSSRFVGGTASGAPASGTFAVNDLTIDSAGNLWVCTVAGSPGTWVRIPGNPLTTQGDLYVGGASGVPSRLAAGTAGYVLTSAGASATPTWSVSTGGSGGGSGGTGGSIVPIQTQTSTASTVTFVVPSGFKNLRITGTGRSDAAASTANVLLQFNGDTTTNYDYQFNSSGSPGTSTAGTSILIGRVAGSSAGTSSTGALEIEIPDHASTTLFKSALAHSQVRIGSANQGTDSSGGQWRSTDAIITVTLSLASGSFVTGSSFTLWGEADTAPVLLTSNSNLLYETTLSATAATIAIPNIPQGYRDLMLTWQGRGTASATFVTMSAQFNGDTTASYDRELIFSNGASAPGGGQSIGATSVDIGQISAATAPSGATGTGTLTVSNYAGVTYRKATNTLCSFKTADSSGGLVTQTWAGEWRNASALTSIILSLSSGSFAAGSTVRVYGLPAAAAGPSVGTGTKLRISGNQSITSATATLIGWDTEDNDADNQHYTSAANLTGTVTKTAASTTLTGSGTAFTTELSVGQVISVPGTAAEKRVVVAIASATSLTVNTAYANSASGQTAARVNTAIVFRQPGFYAIEVGIYSSALASGAVTLGVVLNDVSTPIKQIDPTAINASAGYGLSLQRNFQMWDFIEVAWTQNSGGAVNVLTDERTHIAVASRPTVIIAPPVVIVQDQKASATSGGTATSGSWQTRTLNTISSDTAGIASLASNQLTLPPGTYKVRIRAPAYKCGRHQARLQNITTAATILVGSSGYSNSAGEFETDSVIAGQFRLDSTNVLEVQHQVQTTAATFGYGVDVGTGFAVSTEVYTQAEFNKIG